MLTVRRPFVFAGTNYTVGDVLPDGLLDQYQHETFKRVGFVTETSGAPVVEPVAETVEEPKRKIKMTEVKAEADVLVI